MNSMNISDLVKAIMMIVGLAISVGKLPALTDFALRKGIEAVTYHDYKPVHFFPSKRAYR